MKPSPVLGPAGAGALRVAPSQLEHSAVVGPWVWGMGPRRGLWAGWTIMKDPECPPRASILLKTQRPTEAAWPSGCPWSQGRGTKARSPRVGQQPPRGTGPGLSPESLAAPVAAFCGLRAAGQLLSGEHSGGRSSSGSVNTPEASCSRAARAPPRLGLPGGGPTRGILQSAGAGLRF